MCCVVKLDCTTDLLLGGHEMVEHGGVVSVLACVRSDTLSGVGPVHHCVM